MSTVNKSKPTDIHPILDLAQVVRMQGRRFVPCFSGDAGLGKSEICQQWVAKRREHNPDYGFIDLRIALLEPPDFIGMPKVTEEDGTVRTKHILPEFWPTSGEGLILLEEPNRANTSMMNCLMQLLTDRKVHNYSLPEGWMIAACINEGGKYDVNEMDTALRDRFEIYPIRYDFQTFMNFVTADEWHQDLATFIKTGAWMYKAPEELGEEGHYISPRTLSKLNTALKAGVDKMPAIYHDTIMNLLGKNVGREYYKFVSENRPLFAQDFMEDDKAAFKRLDKICDDNSYRGDLIEIAVNSLIDYYENGIDDKIILKVAHMIPKDQTVNLLRGCCIGKKNKKELSHFTNLDPSLKPILKQSLRG